MRRTVLLVLTLAVPALAGCAGDGGGDNPVDACNPQVEDCDDLLSSGKGAIAGLLVDDRFRPIHLTDDPETEYQAEGFVLLQETGEQVQTTENGEFNFLDLEPGMYTLRVTASGHEATPQQVEVVEGEFAEKTVIARRTVSEGSTIVTESYAAFASCLPNGVAFSFRLDCTGDESGDTERSGFVLNYTGLQNVTWVVAEALFNQYPRGGASFDVTMRDASDTTNTHTAAVLWERRYAKMHLQHGETSPDPVPEGDEFHTWYANETFTLEMFGRGYLAEEIRTTYQPIWESYPDDPCIPTGLGYCLQEVPMRRGAGGQLGVEAQFLVTVFLGEPETAPLEYCGLCDPDA